MKYATFQTLTVGQYQQLYEIHTGEGEDLDKIIQSVCILTSKTEKEVEDMTVPDFNKVSSEIARIFTEANLSRKPKAYIKIGGKRFGITYNPATLTTGQYVEIQTWMRSNLTENINKIMASLVYPIKGRWPFLWRGKYNAEIHPKISEQILDCKFIEVHSTCVFFLKLWRNSIKALVPYLEKELKKKGQTKEKMQELRTILKQAGDGFLMPNELQTLKI